MKVAVAGAAVAILVAVFSALGRASAPRPIVFSADRAPTVSGEVYRLDPNGRRVNLSKSPYQDMFPAVSPNGKKVAFIRDTGQSAYAYEVGINGRGRIRVGPALPRPSESGCDPTLAWQPGGNELAIGVCGSTGGKIWIVQPGKTRLVPNAGLQLSWSPDGRVLVASVPSPHTGTVLHAYSASGTPLWQAPRVFPWFATWSSTNLVAIPGPTGVVVYTEAGHLVSKTLGHPSGGPAWSTNGQYYAVIAARHLVVRSAVGEGVLLDQPLAGSHALVWDGNDHVVVGGYGSCGCKAKSVDIQTGTFSAASSRWFATLSPDGKLAILAAKSGAGYAIKVAPTAGGAAQTYGHVPLAYNDGPELNATNLQFVGSTRSLVYASSNPEPFMNLYTVAPSGGAPHRLSGAKPYAATPSLSPDGSKIGYSWSQYTGLTCKGCASQIRVVNADGTGMQVLTTPGDCTYDVSPSWSPDGQTILYSESSCSNPDELFTIPASGGSPHDLGVAGSQPAWGPVRIAWSNNGIWTANPDGSNPVRVSKHGSLPAYSTTGALAYINGTKVVWGGTAHQLPFAAVSSLAWSPDGTRFIVIAMKARAVGFDLYSVRTDGTHAVRLTKNYGVVG